MFNFNSRITIHKYNDFNYSDFVIKNEPMLFNCDVDYAYKNGGKLTKNFLDKLNVCPTVIDSRVHMLMPNWYPCIPGWHHDDVPRTRTDGQPNYLGPTPAKHAMCIVGTADCPTEFAVGEISLPDVALNNLVYKTWHPLVENACNNNIMLRYKAENASIIYFDSHSFHQGTSCKKGGWRWFIRASWDTDRKPSNEIRKQVNIYMSDLNEGW